MTVASGGKHMDNEFVGFMVLVATIVLALGLMVWSRKD